MAIPSVKMLLEYMEPLRAAKRHRRETAMGIKRTPMENSLLMVSFLVRKAAKDQQERAAKMLWANTAAVK